MNKSIAVSALAFITCFGMCLHAQTTINGSRDFKGSVSFSGPTGTVSPLTFNIATPPSTCTPGAIYFALDATPGQNLYFCTGTNTLTQMTGGGGGGNLRGTFSALPTCNGTKSGVTYWVTDGVGTLAECDGTSWQWFFRGSAITPPTIASTWTAYNIGSATFTDSKGSIFLTVPAATGQNFRGFLKAVPATPYTRTILLNNLAFGDGPSQCDIVLTDGTASTNKIETVGFYANGAGGPATISIQDWTNATTFSAFVTTFGATGAVSPIAWYRINDDGTNRTYSLSTDGINFTTLASRANTSFLTATHYGVLCNSNSTDAAVSTTLLSVQ